ncbi:hypothetical protein LCGC14_1356850 [marine sediment metagenome]|uniref:Uncharacterized protein n=1 Tax=marine sediment metagenome TaxID=412755 RepID=A0A0F9MPL5_9ZZZZ
MLKFSNKFNKKSKKSTLKIFLCCFLTLIILFSAIRINEINTEQTTNSDFPNLSVNEIIINTPENKTYTSPMSGYYPATYGFENDDIGSNPDEWISDETYGDIQVISAIDNHKNVVEIDDRNSASGWPGIIQNSTFPRTYGTIEFWVRFNSTSGYLQFHSRDSTENRVLLRVSVEAGKWRYRNNAGTLLIVPNVEDPMINTWTHIRIDFRCYNAPSYLGMSDDRFVITINGTSSGELQHWTSAKSDYKYFGISTDPTTVMTAWVDAVGFSWDPNYTIGDNLNEGLLLSYENSTNLEWQGYSLDGQANKTILGNTTISMPADGPHSLQVFGNNSGGVMYESDIRYFTLDTSVAPPSPYINIITPENRTYTGPMSGYYPATYGFENDDIGSNPDEWISDETYGDIQVISAIDNHKNVVEIDDRNSASGWPGIIQNSTFPRTYGTIEFWVRFNSTSDYLQFHSRDSTENRVLLRVSVEAGKWRYRNNAGTLLIVPNVEDPMINTWTHIRIDFRCYNAPSYLGMSDDRFVITINGTSSGELQHWTSAKSDYKYFGISTDPTTVMTAWVDAVGFSWDPNYTIGDNLNEGLLLSYENSTNLEWQGYSLDGQTNITILGNTTIPMPADGPHSIQVFGNDSLGVIYESPIRYFTIDTTAPVISGIDTIIELELDSSYILVWNITDISGGTYIILKNASIESAGTFENSDTISINVDTTELGYITYTLIAQDLYNKTSSHTVLVKIISHEPPGDMIPGFNVIILLPVTFIAIGIIIKFKYKNKK